MSTEDRNLSLNKNIGSAAGQRSAARAAMGRRAGVVPWPERLLPDRVLAAAAGVLLACVAAALLRGHADWGRLPGLVWAHLATIMLALGLTPVMLLRRKGDARHRMLGYVWVAAMFGTAALSFAMRYTNHGAFSFIHVISVFTIVQVPLIVVRARRHEIARHRRAVRGMVVGALLIAGFFTFPFDRLLGHWLFAPWSPAHAAPTRG